MASVGVAFVGIPAVPVLPVRLAPEQQRPLDEERDRPVHDHPEEGERGDEPEVVEEGVHHFRTLSSVMSTVSLSRKIAIRIASPTAASAAATVITMKAKTDPVTSPR